MTVRVRPRGLMGVAVIAALALSGCSTSSSHNKSAASSGPAAASSASPSAAVSSTGVAVSPPADSAAASALASATATSAGATTQSTATARSTQSASKSPSTPAKLTAAPTPTATASPTAVPSTATPTVGAFTVALSANHMITSSGSGRGGESGAPAVQFTLTFTNQSGAPVSIDSNTVTVTDDSADPMAWSEDSPDNGDDDPANGTVAVGQSIQGKYVFVVPSSERGHTGLKILIYVSTGTAQPQPIRATVN